MGSRRLLPIRWCGSGKPGPRSLLRGLPCSCCVSPGRTRQPATGTGSVSAIPRVEVHQLRESEEAVATRFEAADDLGHGGYGVGAVCLREGVGVLSVVQQADAAWTETSQYPALDNVRWWTVPVPGHYRPPNAPEAELFGG